MKKTLIKYKTGIRYVISSISSFLVDQLAFRALLIIISPFINEAIIISTYLARTISSIYNYILNKKYVFEYNKKDNKSLISYFVLVIINATVSGLLVKYLYNNITWNVSIIKIIIDSSIFIINFFIQKLFIFKKVAK